jgi:hypothetical protein
MIGFIDAFFVQALLITSNTALLLIRHFIVHRYTRTRILSVH